MTKELTEADIANVHPLPGALVTLIDERGWDDVVLADEEMTELRAGLEEIYGEEQLRDAVRGLLNLGAFLQENGSPTGSKQLLDMLAEQPILDALDALNAKRHEEKSDEVAKTSEAFGAFAGTATEKKAPKVGEKKPDGALSIDQLKFPKRL